MKDLLLLILLFFAFTFVISAVFSILAFLIDVCKWHLMEKKIIVKASKESEVNSDERDNNGSSDRRSERGADRSSNGADAGSSDGDSDRDSGSGSSSDAGTESRERDSRFIFDSWLQP